MIDRLITLNTRLCKLDQIHNRATRAQLDRVYYLEALTMYEISRIIKRIGIL